VKSIVIIILLIGIFSASLSPVHGIDTEFILECSTWYESYELTSKSEFIAVLGLKIMWNQLLCMHVVLLLQQYKQKELVLPRFQNY